MSQINQKAYTDRGLEMPNQQAIPPFRVNSVVNFNAGIVRRDALQTKLLMHDRFMGLVENFLAHKRQHGSNNEKQFYAGMTVGQEIARLFRDRPLAFLNSTDSTKLRNGKQITNGRKLWDAVGTDREGEITLREYLSYDEIMLGSLVGVSSPSIFINDGARSNHAQIGQPGTFEQRGIIVGLVGARFERPEHMDSNLILKDKRSQQDPALTQIFLDFLGVQKRGAGAFDVEVYVARMEVPISLLLLEAQTRAQLESRKAYVYVVGLGLGVWQVDNNQPTYYIQAACRVLQGLKHKLTHIATIEFAWIDVDMKTQDLVARAAAELGIKVKFSQRNPAAKLPKEEQDQLLVISYAWDANSYPGNEYWMGSLDASGDPAAAAMSTIAEIQNPESNPNVWRQFESL